MCRRVYHTYNTYHGGLKKAAYDTLETEISNTLDSSRGSQSGTRETVDEEGEARPVSEPASDAEVCKRVHNCIAVVSILSMLLVSSMLCVVCL